MTNPGDRKVWAFGDAAHEKIAEGLRKGAEVVGSTLGVDAHNVLIERANRTPIVVDDGYTAINNLILEDELENLGITSLVDAANKASNHAGDGTSTTVVLTEAIYRAGRKCMGTTLMQGKRTYEIRKEIMDSKDFVIEELKKSSKPIKTKEEIRKVAFAAYSDEAMAGIVADLVEKVGENGIVIVEEGWGRETEVELITGMRFAGKLAHGLFANTAEEGLSLENVPILVTDFDFVNMNDISALIKDVVQSGEQNLVIIANKYERVGIDQIIRTNIFNAQNRSPFRLWLVRTPSRTPSEFENLATFVGARYFSKEKGESIVEAKVEDLGRASSFKVSKNGDGVILGGAGKKSDIDTRIKELKKRWEEQKVDLIKNRTAQEIASLAAAVGIIKVASPSDGETEHIRLKTKNAVKSAQAAVAEGVVEGAGKALWKIANKLDDGNILKEALKAPHEIIKRNAGETSAKGIFDALKVVRTAVEQACSQAWLLINTKTAIALRSQRDWNDGSKEISNAIRGVKIPGRKGYENSESNTSEL